MTVVAVVTTKGYKIVTGRMIGSTSAQPEPKYMHWGTGVSGASISDETISDPSTFEGRVTGTSSQTTTTTPDDTYTVVATLTCGNPSGESITNMGLFDIITAAPATTLAVECLTTDTTITVVSSTGFPVQADTGNFDIQILTEVMTVTTQAGSVWTVTRAANGSTKISSTIPATTNVIGGSGTSGGNLFLKASFDAFSLDQGDAIAITANMVCES